MNTPLHQLSELQARWSSTATHLKRSYDRARWFTFGLAILGALTAAIASQLDARHRLVLVVASAVSFALVSFFSARFLGTGKVAQWTRSRAASEALKRLAYTAAAQASPYDADTTRNSLLTIDIRKVEADVDDLLAELRPPASGRTPTTVIDARAYATHVDDQIRWYEVSATRCLTLSRRLRRAEFLLALFTTVVTAALGAVDKAWLREVVGLDLVALTAVLTTISGAILAHIEASRYEALATNYRATARRLRDTLATAPVDCPVPSTEWSTFVRKCEAVIAEENGSWISGFSKRG